MYLCKFIHIQSIYILSIVGMANRGVILALRSADSKQSRRDIFWFRMLSWNIVKIMSAISKGTIPCLNYLYGDVFEWNRNDNNMLSVSYNHCPQKYTSLKKQTYIVHKWFDPKTTTDRVFSFNAIINRWSKYIGKSFCRALILWRIDNWVIHQNVYRCFCIMMSSNQTRHLASLGQNHKRLRVLFRSQN